MCLRRTHEELVVGGLRELSSIIELARTFSGARSEDVQQLAVRPPMRNPATGVRARYVRAVAENLHRGVGRYTLDASFEAGDVAKIEGAQGHGWIT